MQARMADFIGVKSNTILLLYIILLQIHLIMPKSVPCNKANIRVADRTLKHQLGKDAAARSLLTYQIGC